MAKPADWKPFASIFRSARNPKAALGQSAVPGFAIFLAAWLIFESYHGYDYGHLFLKTTTIEEGVIVSIPTAVALMSALCGFLLLEVAQWWTDHHHANSEGTVMWQPRLLTHSGYRTMLLFCYVLVVLVRLSPDYFWFQWAIVQFTHWALMVYACCFFCERPPGIVPTVSSEAPRVVNEMAQPGSTATDASEAVEKNLVSFYNTGSAGELVFIGTGFIVGINKDRYIVTANHVFQDAELVGRPRDFSSLIQYHTEIEKGNLSSYISVRYDYVMVKISKSLFNRFGAGFQHMVPRYSHSEIFVPAIMTDETLLYKGRSFTYYERVASPKPLRHTATTYAGCSGAPVLVYGNGKYQAIGIHLGADTLSSHNFGVYFGLVQTDKDVADIERLSDKFSESTVPKDRRGRVIYPSEEEYEDYDHDLAIMEDQYFDYYTNDQQDAFVAVPKRRGRKRNFGSRVEEAAKPSSSKAQKTSLQLVAESAVGATPSPVKPAALKVPASGASTKSPKTSGKPKEQAQVLTSLAEQLSSGQLTQKQFRSCLGGLVSESAKAEGPSKPQSQSLEGKSIRKQK